MAIMSHLDPSIFLSSIEKSKALGIQLRFHLGTGGKGDSGPIPRLGLPALNVFEKLPPMLVIVNRCEDHSSFSTLDEDLGAADGKLGVADHFQDDSIQERDVVVFRNDRLAPEPDHPCTSHGVARANGEGWDDRRALRAESGLDCIGFTARDGLAIEDSVQVKKVGQNRKGAAGELAFLDQGLWIVIDHTSVFEVGNGAAVHGELGAEGNVDRGGAKPLSSKAHGH